jgi:UDP-glucose:(heptosyl)LPS alpha-1,3-glucosyltransferase
MKIAIIRKKYIFHGGAESFSQNFIRAFTAAGHEVHIYAARWKVPEDIPNVHFHRVPCITFNSLLRDLSFVISTYFMLRRSDYDIIQTHDKTLWQDIYRGGDGCHLSWLQERWKRTTFLRKCSIAFNPYHWLVLMLERIILRTHRYRRSIAISQFVKRNMLDNYRVPPEDIDVIYNGADLEKFHPRNRERHRADVRARHGISEDETVALFLGSGFERKGVRFLLKALELVPEPLTVLIAGRGPKLPYNDPHNNKKVIYTGPVPDSHAYYASADMFVFPTVYEPFGNVHFEALASGLPVVTTGLAGGGEVIEQGVDGFVVPLPESSQEIADAIRAMLDPDRRAEMSRKAREKAEQFTFDRHIAETMKVYERVLREKG